MQITITARHFELTKAIRDYVEAACEKLNRYFDQIITLHVTLTLENSRNICEITLHASKFTLQSESEEMDMYLAVDNTIEKMEGQIKKLKDRVTDHQKKGLKENNDEYYSRAFLYAKENKGNPRRLIKTKRVVPEVMTVQEALDVMEAGEDDYFIFKNVETDRINVLVKKDADHFKLLEP
ncbi:MAG TPA: ribosome-associated translation inhibitor RaiA [Candidatus Cloacimonadota bacterium]|nr:ribosome-associated translation inhibitor RaiA [Candidatus Cloacimonadota bacterium]HPT72957.1 ribosome-associated translation inhibitor RaiA [Candidatus Cloacimonadota bacterium]